MAHNGSSCILRGAILRYVWAADCKYFRGQGPAIVYLCVNVCVAYAGM